MTPRVPKSQYQERNPTYPKYPNKPNNARKEITTMLFMIPSQLLVPDHLNNPPRDSIILSIS